MKIGLIVEGHGEVAAMPILLRRIAAELVPPRYDLDIPQPLRVPRDRLVNKPSELARAVELMARKTSPDGVILIVLDADDACPAELGPGLLEQARAVRADRRIAVVVANREFEAWFLAAASSLAGQRGLPEPLEAPDDPESVRGAKEWLGRRAGRYSETLDQPALTAVMSLDEARQAPSFDKLLRDVSSLLSAV